MTSSNEKSFTALVAVDDSARGPDVVRAAATFVRALPGMIVLYRGVSMPPDFTPALTPSMQISSCSGATAIVGGTESSEPPLAKLRKARTEMF